MILQELYANLISIGAALARYAPLSTEINRPLYGDLVILDDPFHMQFLLYLTVLLICHMYTLTAQQWLPMAMWYPCALSALLTHSTKSRFL